MGHWVARAANAGPPLPDDRFSAPPYLCCNDSAVLVVDELEFPLDVTPPWHRLGVIHRLYVTFVITLIRTRAVLSKGLKHLLQPFPVTHIVGVFLFFTRDRTVSDLHSSVVFLGQRR